MPLLHSRSKLQNQPILLPFCAHSTGCQCLLEYNAKYPPSVTVPCQIPVRNTCPKSCKFMHHLDNSVRPVTTALFVYPLSKQKHMVKDPFHMQALSSGTNIHMTSEVDNQKPHSKRPSKPVSLLCTTESQNVPSRLPQMSQSQYSTLCCCCCFYAPLHH